jgi:hypothetical protein
MNKMCNDEGSYLLNDKRTLIDKVYHLWMKILSMNDKLNYHNIFLGLVVIKVFLKMWTFKEITCLKCENLNKSLLLRCQKNQELNFFFCGFEFFFLQVAFFSFTLISVGGGGGVGLYKK